MVVVVMFYRLKLMKTNFHLLKLIVTIDINFPLYQTEFKLLFLSIKQIIMSLQGKTNRNAAKRIYNINSLNNPLILDLMKSQDTKLNILNNPLYYNNKNQQHDDKNSLLSITGKEVINPHLYQRSSNKRNTKNGTELVRNIKEIQLILEEQDNMQFHQQQRHFQNVDHAYQPQLHHTDGPSSQKNLQKLANIQKYYEDVIINQPQIYNKVVSAYKNLKQNLNSSEKAKQFAKKRLSTNKITGIDRLDNVPPYKEKPARIMHKLIDNDPKNDQQRKKILYFNIYREFQLLLNLSNQCIMIPESEGQYRAFVGKGNNGLLIKSILKSRPWWCIRTVNDLQSCNFIWTEWKKPKYMKMLPSSKFQKKNQTLSNSQETNVSLNLKTNRKLEAVSRILTENKINQISTCFDLKEGEQITRFNKRISDSSFTLFAQKSLGAFEQKPVSKANKMVNHIPGCFQLHSKKLLFANLKKYYEKKKMNVYNYLPQTYVISKGLNDPEYQRFLQGWQANQKLKENKGFRNIWICKPGENSNRGNGITVAGTLTEIKNFITSHSSSNGMCSALIQKYLQNPFLYNKRKFDMRCYVLITTVNGIVKGYWYQEGYIRTTSKEYNLKNIENKFIHLTNDAVQKKGETYGKFQNFNKVTFQDFQKYLQQNYAGSGLNFKTSQQKMKQMATDLIHSVGKKLNPDKKQFSFELFGLDFMLDDKLQAFIIEANSNPCIQVEGNVLGRVIPAMLENMMRLVVDPIFPPPYSESIKNTKYSPGNVVEQNKFTLVYDSLVAEPTGEVEVITKEEQEEERLMEAQIQRENQQQL